MDGFNSELTKISNIHSAQVDGLGPVSNLLAFSVKHLPGFVLTKGGTTKVVLSKPR